MSTIYLFIECLTVLSSLFLVFNSQNPIRSILYLIATVFGLRTLTILLGFEFLRLAFLVVYVGAVVVLFLFVVMMLNLSTDEKGNVNFLNSFSIDKFIKMALCLFLFFMFEEFVAWLSLDLNSFQILENKSLEIPSWQNYVASNNENIHLLGSELYSQYSDIVIACGLALLVAMFGAIILNMDL